ncbi:hypothetical protein Hanom_Chr01g00010151 [Helianthus anomalus]
MFLNDVFKCHMCACQTIRSFLSHDPFTNHKNTNSLFPLISPAYKFLSLTL